MSMNEIDTRIQKPAVVLAYAGLIPQALCVALFFLGEEYSWFALTFGFGYGIMIFSFIGGIWWGQAIMRSETRTWIYLAAIAPSLIALCLYMPWAFGWEWPGPQLVMLGMCLIGSPLVDRQTEYASANWMKLRWHLSLGIRIMTITLGVAA
jgi:hypothetical protein